MKLCWKVVRVRLTHCSAVAEGEQDGISPMELHIATELFADWALGNGQAVLHFCNDAGGLKE